MAAKAGYARGPARPSFDDSDWRSVRVPHDWSVEGPFDPANHMSAGYLPRGVGWYRRLFVCDRSWKNDRVVLRFGAVSSRCVVYVNGHQVHRHFDGYTPFEVDITDVITFGDDAPNTIAVRVDATEPEGWWYEGAGIYREVRLVRMSRTHLVDDSITIRPTVTARRATIRVEGTVFVEGASAMTSAVRVGLFDGSRRVANSSFKLSGDRFAGTLVIQKPRRWSVDSPHLYAVRVELMTRSRVIDRVEIPSGLRSCAWDAKRGFVLNGTPTKLKGVCVHQDHAGVGVAVPASIQRFRVQRLKDIGCNAVRIGHHLPDESFLDACDRLGMLVIDENRHFGTSIEHRRQLESMVRRDRNRACVIAWSLCNEEPTQGTVVGQQIARTMKAQVKTLDPTRPVTAAVSGGILNDVGIAHELDVMSINYQLHLHEPFHEKHPEKVILAAETGCVYATRGVTRTETERHHFADDDTQCAPWGHRAEEAWKAVSDKAYVAGQFVWTGFDYRGEPTPHEWPSVQSHWGLLDLCGFDKAAALRHRQWWTGQPTPTDEVAGKPVALGLEVHPSFDASYLPADGAFTIPITAFAVDSTGRRSPFANLLCEFDVSGEAEFVGTGNGDPTSTESNVARRRSLFNGLAQILVRTTTRAGSIDVRATTPGLKPALLTIRTAKSRSDHAPVVARRWHVGNWRRSPVSPAPIDLGIRPDEQDMNSWERLTAGQALIGTGWFVMRSKFRLPKSMCDSGATLNVSRVKVCFACLVDETVEQIDRNTIRVPPGAGEREIALLVKQGVARATLPALELVCRATDHD
jgi:beta-galactosidase